MSDWVRYLLLGLAVVAAAAVVFGHLKRHRVPLPLPTVSLPAGIARSVFGWLILSITVAAGTVGGLLWVLGWPKFPSSTSFSTTEILDLLKIGLAVVAGFGGVVLLAINFRKQRVAEDEHDLAIERADREVTQGFNERFGAAAEQLAHASAAVRMAGVYAMAGLADDWKVKRQVCVDVLCGYLRMPQDDDDEREEMVSDAIMRTIRDRTTPGTFGFTDWLETDFDFTGIEFKDLDLSGLLFGGTVTFDRATFTGELTSFARTEFAGKLSCHGTTFAAKQTNFTRVTGSRMEFVGAEFTSPKIDLSGMELDGVGIYFYRSRFRDTEIDFSGLDIETGGLIIEQCEFERSDLNLSLLNTVVLQKFGRLAIDGCRFTGGLLDLSDVGDPPRLARLVNNRFADTEIRGSAPWFDWRDNEVIGTEPPWATSPPPDKPRPGG
ncbi:hypothetical protein SAMN05421504_102886 [Amycolatopsis xylanica]|uniref:Pentapeptide repeat-containing protein n=1 Tax=Amycolatopsis xylanica TaxID=589385 RepID=A0A1H3ADE5_9PSEU|nr:hypothetical protein [Amycolatopsis xylanica]SDX27732.1 hypothetical protein SAMN05421504_102886 [Amycolatopsis xylanica]